MTPTNCMQSNPIARWHICQGSINGIAFSNEGAYLATVGRDGITLYISLHLVFFLFFPALVGSVIDLSVLLVQVTCESLTIQKNNLYVVGKVIMVLYYVVLGGD